MKPSIQKEEAAAAALATSLRSQIMDRVRSQEQIVVLTIALVGVAISFGNQLRNHPELTAVVGLLFIGFALVMLRQDQEITLIADYLRTESAFGIHAHAQAGWEQRKHEGMQSQGLVADTATAAQVIAIYGTPVIGGAGFLITAIWFAPSNWRTWAIAVIGFVFVALFFAGARRVYCDYRNLGWVKTEPSQQSPSPPIP